MVVVSTLTVAAGIVQIREAAVEHHASGRDIGDIAGLGQEGRLLGDPAGGDSGGFTLQVSSM